LQRKLKVFGLEEKEANPDQEDGGAVDTYAILLDFMENTLDLGETARLFELQRAHRLGRPVAGKTKPIFARFLRRIGIPKWHLKLASSSRMQPRLKCSVEDHPKGIIERRRKQMPKLKEAKKKGLRVSFSKAEQDKLFINEIRSSVKKCVNCLFVHLMNDITPTRRDLMFTFWNYEQQVAIVSSITD